MSYKKFNICVTMGLLIILFLLELIFLWTMVKYKSYIGISLIFIIILSVIITLGITVIILEKLLPKNKISKIPERIISWINDNIQPI